MKYWKFHLAFVECQKNVRRKDNNEIDEVLKHLSKSCNKVQFFTKKVSLLISLQEIGEGLNSEKHAIYDENLSLKKVGSLLAYTVTFI